MLIPTYLFNEEEFSNVKKKLKAMKIPYGCDGEMINIACSSSGPLSEDKVLYKLIEEDVPYASREVMDKQFAIKAVTRILALLPKIETPDAKMSAVSAIISLYKDSPRVASKLLNLIPRK